MTGRNDSLRETETSREVGGVGCVQIILCESSHAHS